MSLTGFKLTLNDGTVFRCSSDVDVTHGFQSNYLIDGFRNFIALFDDAIEEIDIDQSNGAGFFGGFGAGIKTITIEFTQKKGSPDEWGSASQNDPAITKLQTLDHALSNTKTDSTEPGTLEVYEYSEDGKYTPLTVALGEYDLPSDVQNEASAFSGSITFYESIDAGEVASAGARNLS